MHFFLSLLLSISPFDFVEVNALCEDLECELYLFDPKNPVGIPLFSKHTCCLVHQACYSNVIAAALEAKSMGYRLKVIDALRPLYIQEALFAVIQDERFISTPGGDDDLHSRGLSIDVILLDAKGNALPMPSNYLEVTGASYSDYREGNETERLNREILADIMVRTGFKRHPFRWWEYQSTYWDCLTPEGKKALTPFNLPIEEVLCPGRHTSF